MSRRKTVELNLEYVNPKIKAICRSNVVFCEKMGRAYNWVTDWNRKAEDGTPKPKNLPSPEEAARMCVILETTPDKILVKQEDIVLVNSLLEQERGEKPSTVSSEGLSEPEKEVIRLLRLVPPERQPELLEIVRNSLKIAGLL